MELVKKYIKESIQVKENLLADEKLISRISDAAALCTRSLAAGGKVLFAGNGGSAADAQHLAGELVNRFGFERPALAAMSLTTDPSVLTSISNDYSFNRIIARQIEAVAKEGDVLFAISTSGNSENIIAGIHEARQKGMKIIGLTGKSGGKMSELCDILINIPSEDTPRIQESHILAGHIICSLIEISLFKQ
ncbi:MAG: D-sedoheptulose 7-phosphate isomerase [Bacteroidales bacterium]